MFNAEDFLNSATDPLATAFEVCPEGEFAMLIDSDPKQLVPEEKSGTSIKTGKDYHFWTMSLNCIVQDEAVKAKVGRDKVTVRMQINLDIDEATGRLATGPNKNVFLGQLRDALGQNTPGWKPTQLLGAGPFMGKVTHTSGDRGTFANVTRVAKIS